MAQIPPIQDAYIDSIIRSAGAYQPALNKTQGIKLRELFKVMRDRMEQGTANSLPLSGGTMTGNIQFTDQENSGIRWDRYTDYGKIFFESLNASDTTPSNTVVWGRSNMVFLLGDDGYNQDHFVFRYHQGDASPADIDTFVISNDYLYMRTLLNGVADGKVLTIGTDRKVRERVIGRGANQMMAHNENGDTLIGRLAILGSVKSVGDDLSAGAAVQLTDGFEGDTIGKAARMQLGNGGDILFKTFAGPGNGTGSWSDRLRIKNASGTLEYSADVSLNYTPRSLVDKAYVDSKIVSTVDTNQSLGAWNAATNTPALSTTPAAVGRFYEVSVAGTQSVTGTAVAYLPMDKLISNGTAWQYIPFTNTNGTITVWTPQVYKSGAYVNYLGKDWIADVPVVAGDIPGTSSKWSNRLYAVAAVDSSGELMSNLRAKAVTGKELYNAVPNINLFNPLSSAIEKMAYINSGGYYMASGSPTQQLNKIKVKPNTIYRIYNGIGLTPVNPPLAIVLSSGQTLAVVNASYSAEAGYITPANAKELWFTTRLDDTTTMVIEGSVAPSSFIKFGYKLYSSGETPLYSTADFLSAGLNEQASIDIILKNIQKTDHVITPNTVSFLTPSLNLYNPHAPDIVKQAYINSGGYYVPSGSPTQQVVKIKVKGNTRYSFFDAKATIRRLTPQLQITTQTGKVNVPTNGYTTEGYYTTPANALEIWVNTTIDQISYMVIEGTETPTSFIDFGYSFTTDILGMDQKDKYPWLNKNAGFLGDSITMQFTYGEQLIASTRMINAYRDGQNGQVIAAMGTGLTAENIANLDLITILAGTNDYGHGAASQGTINSPMDGSTIHGSVKLVVNRILSLKPNIRIVFFTPFNRGKYGAETLNGYVPNGNGLTIKNIADAIQDECRYLGIPSYDLLSATGINSYNLATHCPDNLHPNLYAGNHIGKLMGQFINTLPPF